MRREDLIRRHTQDSHRQPVSDAEALDAIGLDAVLAWLSSQAVSQPISVRKITAQYCRSLGLPPRLVTHLCVEPGQVTAEVMHCESGIPHFKVDDRSELCTGEALAIVAGRWSPATAACGATFEIPDTEH